MKKDLMIFLVIVLAIGAFLFYDQVLSIFRGMTVLESMQLIWTFILHVAVTTALVWGAYTLPEIIKPLLKTFRWKHRIARRGRYQPKTESKKHITWPWSRGSKDQAIWWMMSQLAKRSPSNAHELESKTKETDDDHISLDF